MFTSYLQRRWGKTRNLVLALVFTCTLAASSITVASCTTPISTHLPETTSPVLELPPVFDNINNFSVEISADAISRPRIYKNLSKSQEPHDWSVELTSDIDLPASPDTLNAYRIIRPNIDEEYARKVAEQIGFDKPVEEVTNDKLPFPRNKCFIVQRSDPSGKAPLGIYQNGVIVVFFKEATEIYSIPSDQECIRIAQDWLNSTKLYPDGVINVMTTSVIQHVMQGAVESEYPITTSVNFLIGIDGYELYGMGAYVSISNNGEICGAYINVPKLEKCSIVNIRKPETAFGTLRDYLAEPSKFWSYSPECLLSYIAPQMTVEKASLKYFPMSSVPSA